MGEGKETIGPGMLREGRSEGGLARGTEEFLKPLVALLFY